MGKSTANAVIDGMLNVVVNSVSHMIANDTEPTTFAAAVSSSIAFAVMSTNDFTIADGDSSGRKVTVGSKGSVNVDVTDDANHVALVNSNDGELLYVTTATSQALTSGNTMNFQAWDIEVADPS